MSSTPPVPEVIEAMTDALQAVFANPSAIHHEGRAAHAVIQDATQTVADYLHTTPEHLIWTSGATESNNLALKGALSAYARKGQHCVVSAIEHASVLETARFLETQGMSVAYLMPDSAGLFSTEQLEKAVQPDTVLVSIGHVNNEIGVVQEVDVLGAWLKARGVLFHVDAAQSLGKVPLDLSDWPVDLVTLTAHKAYGPKGVGLLWRRLEPMVRLTPHMHGGGQQQGLRSGTLPTHQIVGMAAACCFLKKHMQTDLAHVKSLQTRLWEGLKTLPGILLNGAWENRVPHNVNVSFKGIVDEALYQDLSAFALSSGSACHSDHFEQSHVLSALGRDTHDAAIRFSLHRGVQLEDIDHLIEAVRASVLRLHALSPLSSEGKTDV